jgi:hypothetical protein
MEMNDKATGGIASKHEAESPSDKGAWAEACREQEKNMAVDVPSKTMPNKSMIRKYKG